MDLAKKILSGLREFGGKLQAGIPIEGKRVRLNRETGEITVEHAVLEPREKTTKP